MMRLSGSGREARKQKQPSDAGDSVLALVRGIKASTIAVSALRKDSRIACVEHLTAEGWPTSEVADFLGVCPRTIRRDLQEIRASFAVHRTPGAINEIVGRIVRQAEIADNGIRRAVQLKNAKPSDRINGELACWRVTKELVEILQRVGRLPCAPRSDPNFMQQTVSSLIIDQNMITEAQEQKLIEAGMPPGTTPAERVKILTAVDDLRAEKGIGPDGRKIKTK